MRYVLSVLYVLVVLCSTSQAATIYDRPLLPAPTDAARLYIYDPVTHSDRNITWGGLRGFFAPIAPPWASIADKPSEFAPAAHHQSADTITDGVTYKAFTATEKSKLATIQTGATVQVNADWLADSGIAQILNRPAEVCAGRFAYDGSQIYVAAGGCAPDAGHEGDLCIDSLAPNAYYQRLNGVWEIKGTLKGIDGLNGLDGDPGPSYVCAITGGIRTLTYDQHGINPTPTMVAFAVEMRENGTVVTPDSHTWSVPASGSLLSGSSSTATFTPTVAATFSAGAADNRVDVTVTYNGQTCRATAPVPATKIGDDGLQGSADTKQDIYDKIAAGSTGDVLRTQCGPGDAAGFVAREVRDQSGNIILTYTCGGQVTVYQLPGDSSSVVKLAVRGLDGIDHFSVTAGGTVVLR